MKHSQKHHTGKIRHHDMTSLVDGHGKKDKHASAEHHQKNASHGMHKGLTVDGEYDDGDEKGGGSMAGNCEYC